MPILTDATKVYFGTTPVNKVYVGTANVWSTSAPTSDPATTAWINAVVAAGGSVSGSPTTGRQKLVNDLIAGLKTDGVWAKLDRLWIFAAENQTSAKIDLVGLAQVTPVNSPTFTADAGYTGNGTTSYIDTGFNPTTTSGHFISVSSSAGIWDVTTTTASAANQIGSYDAIGYGVDVTLRFTDNNLYARITSNNGPGGVPYPGPGLFFCNHGVTGQAVYYNGSSITAGDVGTPYIPNQNIYVLARNSSGAAVNHSADKITGCFFGGSLNATEHTNFYNRLRTYMTAVGVP